MFDIKPKYLYQVYRFGLSGYEEAKASGTWNDKKVARVDEKTGEIQGERTVYVAEPKHVDAHMCLDDKEINGRSFSILSNLKTGKIALMMDSVRFYELAKGIEFLGNSIEKTQCLNCDMAPGYLTQVAATYPELLLFTSDSLFKFSDLCTTDFFVKG
jgi:hypothetical protein